MKKFPAPPSPALSPLPTPEAVSAALALLARHHPSGFAVDGDGLLVPRAADLLRPRTLAELLVLKSAPRRLKLELAASVVEVEVYALDEKTTNRFERQVPTPLPPGKTKIENGKVVADGWDREDAGYKAALERAYQLRRALTIAAAVPLLAVQGETPEAMQEWILEQGLPVHFLDSLFAAAKALSEQPQERASFI